MPSIQKMRLIRSRTVLRESPEPELHQLTARCRSEFEEALKRNYSRQGPATTTLRKPKSNPLLATPVFYRTSGAPEKTSHDLEQPGLPRGGTFHGSLPRVNFALREEFTGPTIYGGLLHPDLKAEARNKLQTPGRGKLDKIKAVNRLQYYPHMNFSVNIIRPADSSERILMFSPKPLSKTPSRRTTPNSIPVPSSSSEFTSTATAATTQETPTEETLSVPRKNRRRLKNKRHWVDNHTVSSEDENDRRERMREISDLYQRTFGFTTIKRGMTKVAKTRTIKEIAASIQKNPNEAQDEAAVLEIRPKREKTPLLPTLACPSSEIKTREVAVSRWLSGHDFASQPQSHLPIV